MGFFKKLKKAVKKVAKPVVKVAKLATPIGQAQFIAGKIAPSLKPTLKAAERAVTAAVISRVAPVAGPLAAGLVNKVAGTNIPGGVKVGFNLGGVLNVAGQALGGITGQSGIAQGIRTLGAVSSIAAAAIPVKSPQAPMPMAATPAMSILRPAGAVVGGAMATVGRGFFQRFPNLATAIQKFRNAGMRQVTRPRLYGMLRRFGPELLISGGILSAAAISELMVAGPGTRRLNPANVKALRRSVRRIESFHRLCVVTDRLRGTKPKRRKC